MMKLTSKLSIGSAAVLFTASLASPGWAQQASSTLQTLQQATTSAEAQFNNTFTQTISSDVAPQVLTVAPGAGIVNDGTYTLTPNGLNPIQVNGVGVSGLTSAAATMTAPVTAITDILQITAATPAATATTFSTSTTVFGVNSIKATQSVIDSTINTQF